MGDLPCGSESVPMQGHDTSFIGNASMVVLDEAPPPAGQIPCSSGKLNHRIDASATHKQDRNVDSLETEVDISGIKRGKGDDRNSSQYGEPNESTIYESPVSFPLALRLVSAMKGGRERSGETSPTENRRVKWAPDVYDPPVTSVDHSVKSHEQRPRSRKKGKDKQKQKQKRKSRGKRSGNKSGNDCLHNPPALWAPRSSSPHNLVKLETEILDYGISVQDTKCRSSSPHNLVELETEILDYGISVQDTKCGSGFLHGSAAQMHFSAAEAS